MLPSRRIPRAIDISDRPTEPFLKVVEDRTTQLFLKAVEPVERAPDAGSLAPATNRLADQAFAPGPDHGPTMAVVIAMISYLAVVGSLLAS